MPNIVWLGNHFFSSCLARQGVQLTILEHTPGQHIGWEDIYSRAGMPDILVVSDKSLPPFVLGMEDFPCLTALYVVDSHIHSWFPYYAQGFDLCLVSLKDHLPRFLGERLAPEQVVWTPPYCIAEPISPEANAATEKQWDILFAGTVNPLVNPQRVEWMEKFKALEPRLHVTRGSFPVIYPQTRLVLNHSILGDLNFRVFEALGLGAPLLTPRIGHGQEDLFSDGEDFFLFDQRDIPAAAAKAAELLQKPSLLLEVAQSGYNKVVSKHLAQHRADSFLALTGDWLASGHAAELIKTRRACAAAIRKKYLKIIYLLLADSMPGFPDVQKAYLAAATKSD